MLIQDRDLVAVTFIEECLAKKLQVDGFTDALY